MGSKPHQATAYGAWLLLICSLVGLILAAIATFNEANGIAHTPGTYLVLFSTVLLVVGSLLVTFARNLPRWVRGILIFLLLIGLLGTGLAAYLLEAAWLLGAMGIGLVAWLIHVFFDPAGGKHTRTSTHRKKAATA